MTATIGIPITSMILTIMSKLYFPSGGRGNGFNIVGGAWCGTNILNDAGIILVFVSPLVMTYCKEDIKVVWCFIIIYKLKYSILFSTLIFNTS